MAHKSTIYSPKRILSNPQHSAEGQIGYRLRVPEIMNHEKLEWRNKGFCGGSLEMQHALARGVKDGDLVRAYNDRGEVRLCAQVTERVKPGAPTSSPPSASSYRPHPVRLLTRAWSMRARRRPPHSGEEA